MGYRHNHPCRLVAQTYDLPVPELINDILTQIPLDQTCEIKLKVHGRSFDTYESALEMHNGLKGGCVELDFMTLFYLNWKSPTFDAAKVFVETNKYTAILTQLDVTDEDGMFFGLPRYSTVVRSVGGKLTNQ